MAIVFDVALCLAKVMTKAQWISALMRVSEYAAVGNTAICRIMPQLHSRTF